MHAYNELHRLHTFTGLMSFTSPVGNCLPDIVCSSKHTALDVCHQACSRDTSLPNSVSAMDGSGRGLNASGGSAKIHPAPGEQSIQLCSLHRHGWLGNSSCHPPEIPSLLLLLLSDRLPAISLVPSLPVATLLPSPAHRSFR